MSSPQKQVSGRRLPPISPVSNGSIAARVYDKQSPSQQAQASTSGSITPVDFTSVFVQGPFRTPLTTVDTNRLDSPPKKKDRYDKFLFLEDLSHLDPSIIYVFLRESPKLMENFIRDYVSMEELETWLALKSFEKFQEKLSITSFDVPKKMVKGDFAKMARGATS